MRYIDASLAPGEEIIQRGRWPTIFWVGAWASLIFLGIIVVGVFIFLRAAIIMWTTDFAVTNRRVVLKRGWLNRKTEELAVESVEGVLLEQSLIARLFGFGRVIVTGTGDATIRFPPMAHPVAFRRSIESAREHPQDVHVVDETHAPAAREANENERREELHEDEPRRPRRRSSFIGLKARR